MNSAFEKLLRYSAAAILLVAAIAKLYSTAGHSPILSTDDPLFGFHNRYLLILVGFIELAMVAVLLSRTVDFRLKYLALAWLSTSFMVYRAALAFLNIAEPCPCLGTITEKLHLDPHTAARALSVAVVYLFVGSAWLLSGATVAPASASAARTQKSSLACRM